MIIIVSVHIAACILLILVVLLQAGKGVGMGGAAIGSSSQAFFDSSSANGILAKFTTIAASVFMITSLSMSYMHSSKVDSVIKVNKTSTISPSLEFPEDILLDDEQDHICDDSSKEADNDSNNKKNITIDKESNNIIPKNIIN